MLIPTATFGQKSSKIDFSIMVLGCFNSDTLSLIVNGREILNNEIVESDYSLQMTQITLYQDRDGLWLLHGQNKTRLQRIEDLDPLKIQAIFNGTGSRQDVNLRKGKFVLMHSCAYEEQNARTVQVLTIGQSRRR